MARKARDRAPREGTIGPRETFFFPARAPPSFPGERSPTPDEEPPHPRDRGCEAFFLRMNP
jgi:hypothetical protein